MQAAPAAVSLSQARPMAGFAVRPLVPSDPPQIVTDDQLVQCYRHYRLTIQLVARLLHPRPSFGNRRARPAPSLDHQCVY